MEQIAWSIQQLCKYETGSFEIVKIMQAVTIKVKIPFFQKQLKKKIQVI